MPNSKSLQFVFDDEKHLILIGRAIEYFMNNRIDIGPKRSSQNLLQDYISQYNPEKMKEITPQTLDGFLNIYENSIGRV